MKNLASRIAFSICTAAVVLGAADTSSAQSATDARPPAGYIEARIIDVDAAGGGARIAIAAAYGQGVFPDAKGYIVDAKGQPMKGGSFVVEEAYHPKQVRARVELRIDAVNGGTKRVFVEASSRRCTPPDPGIPSGAELARVLKGGAPPAGWIAFDVPASRPSWPRITFNAGTRQGVLPPGNAYFIIGKGTGALHPATIGNIRASSASATVGGENADVLKDAPLRLIVSTGKCT